MDGRLAAALSHPPILENASNLQQTNPMFPDTSPLATGAACQSLPSSRLQLEPRAPPCRLV